MVLHMGTAIPDYAPLAVIPPQPVRPTPVVVYGPHEVRPEQDVDQTLSWDWTIQARRREERNVKLKQLLQSGQPVAYRSNGRSLEPRVFSGDRCSYEPVTSAEQVSVDDVVFCEVQEGDRFYAHLVASKEWHERDGLYYFWISNLKGPSTGVMNGWCNISHIYGRLYNVEK